MTQLARHQRGHVALLMALSIVIVASVVSAGVVEVGISDSRRIAHELRRYEAQAAAEDALDRAALWLRLNASRIRDVESGGWMESGRVRWRVCDESAPRAPCAADAPGERETFDAHWSTYGPLPHLFGPADSGALRSSAWFVARAERSGEPMPGWATVHTIAEGRSRDGTALARLRRSFQLRPLLRRIPETPVAVTGAATLVGGVSIVASDGVPAQSAGSGGDTLSRLFGPADADALRASARRLEDCASLGPGSHALVWIRGDCVLPTGGAIGSAAAPILLVVDSGSARIEGPAEFFGILVLRGAGNTSLLQSNDTFTLHGALMADGDLEIAAESLSIQYEPAVLQPLLQLAGPLSEVAGSWTDHR
jgi:hypothetical protein